MPEVIIVKDQDEAGELYARCVADLIKGKPDAVLGLATGSSPLAAYRHLAAMVKAEDIDVSKVRGFALDEYIGLPLTHPESYHSTIHRTVVEPLGLDPEKVHVPGDVLDGAPLEDGERIAHADPEYDAAIEAAGGIDVQILGIGTDGHVGFNEPGSSLASGTRVKTLAEQTPRRQRPLLRRRHQPGADPLHHAGHRHDPRRPSPGAAGLRRGQGRSGRGDLRGRRERLLPGFRSAAAPARDDHRRRGRRLPPAPQGYYKYAFEHKPAWQGI